MYVFNNRLIGRIVTQLAVLLLQEFILRITARPFPRPPSDERREYLTTTHGKELEVRWPKLWRQWLVLFLWEKVVLVVTPWNAAGYSGGGSEGDGDDNDNNNNFVIYVIVVDKSLMVLLHYSILFFFQLQFELNIRIFYRIYWFLSYGAQSNQALFLRLRTLEFNLWWSIACLKFVRAF